MKKSIVNIPKVNITEDECCIEMKINETNIHHYFEYAKLSNIKLEDLNIASHKLNAINEEIGNIRSKP